MKIWNLTLEKVNDLIAERDAKNQEMKILSIKTPEDLWNHDLDVLGINLQYLRLSLPTKKVKVYNCAVLISIYG